MEKNREPQLERIIDRLQQERCELFVKIDSLLTDLEESGNIILECSKIFGAIRNGTYPYNCVQHDAIKEALDRIDAYFDSRGN